MKVGSRFHIRGRGDALGLKVEHAVVADPQRLRIRKKEGAATEWQVRGVERFVKLLAMRYLLVGETVSVLVPDGCDLAVGDEVELVDRATLLS